MSKQGKESQPDQLQNVQVVLSRSEQFIEKYQTKILIGVAAVVVIVSAFLAFKHFYILPTEKKAQAAMFQGEFYFQADSVELALNGDGKGYIGFEAIAKEYGITKTANLAKAYAGLCYKQLGNYEKAIDMLKSFNADDNLVSPAIVGAIGDCYVEMGNVKEGISYFEKAAMSADNDMVSPIFLKKAGVAYESLEDYKSALKVYNEIKDKYVTSMEATEIEKYIERANNKL